MINYTLVNIKTKFEKAESMPQFPEAIDIVCAGGSSMIGGFVDVFKDELKKMAFPLEINDVRLADEPLYATARGCLLAGLSEVE
ncbi:MAG: hypothetical protein HQL21_08345 [Candidatus Omnitrophica bacterium]|nr:hypothetical protein [Candidatus Omnitrophota bacterium]